MNSITINFFFFYIFLNEHMNIFYLVIYEWVELLGQRLYVFSILKNTNKFVSKMIVTIYIPISSVWEF